MQSTDKRERRYIFTAVKNLGNLVLKIADVRLEAVTLSHFNGEVVVVFFLGLPAGGDWVRNTSVISKLGSKYNSRVKST